MYIYQRYILRRLAVVFLASVLVVTGLLFVGNVLRIIENISLGIKFVTFVKSIVYLVPDLLSYALPMSILTACLLVFARLSAENELIALRTNGISLVSIVAPALIFALIIGCLSLVQLGLIKPAAYAAQKRLIRESGVNPAALFIPRKEIKVGDYMVFIKKRKGGVLYDIIIKQVSKTNRRGGDTPFVKAKWGLVKNFPERKIMRLELYEYSGLLAMGSGVANEQGRKMEIEFNLESSAEKLVKTDEDEMTMKELFVYCRIARDQGKNTLVYTMESNKRIVFSLACVAFAVLGIPLGIKVHRGEKSIGFALSLPLFLAYYMADLMIRQLKNTPQYHPELLQWLPNIVMVIIGLLLFRKIYRGAR